MFSLCSSSHRDIIKRKEEKNNFLLVMRTLSINYLNVPMYPTAALAIVTMSNMTSRVLFITVDLYF